jgi:hypothetical protein
MIAWILLFLLSGCVLQAGTLIASDPPVLQVDQTGTASTTVSIRNTDATPVTIHINLSDFQHTSTTGRIYPLGTTYVFTAPIERDKAVLNGAVPLAPGGSLVVKLAVSRIWEAGDSEAVLKNGDVDIPTESGASKTVLRALHLPQSINVQIGDQSSTTPEVQFASLYARGEKVLVELKNSDPMTYRFRWSLRLGGEVRSAPNAYVDIPANGTVYLDLSPVAPIAGNIAAWFSRLITAGTLKDEVTDGSLVLDPDLTPNTAIPPLAAKILPLTVRLRFWNSGMQELVNVICIFLRLAAGGVASIWVHCGMPNTTRALALQRRLRSLTRQVNGLGADIPSQWRSLMGSQPRRILHDLSGTWWVFPGFAAVLDRLEREVTMVETWGSVCYDLSIVRRRTRLMAQTGVPVTILGWIDRAANNALSEMESGFTNDAEIQSMRAAVAEIDRYLTLVGSGAQIPELEKVIAEREAGLAPCLEMVQKLCHSEFANLLEAVVRVVGTPMQPSDYMVRDTLSLKVCLLNEYCELLSRASTVPAAAAVAAGTSSVLAASSFDTVAARIQSHRARLFDYVRPDAPESLRFARMFIAEMRQDLYEESLRAEVAKNPPAISIVCEPPLPEPNTLVHLAVRFHRDLLNEAAACQEWRCTWDFGDNTPRENGWDAWHSFNRAGTPRVSVSISALNGDAITANDLTADLRVGGAGRERSLTTRGLRLLRSMKPHASTTLEASRLALVLAIAVFGLVNTAQHQASKLTPLEAVGAVFALGFGADTLKNLITDRRS